MNIGRGFKKFLAFGCTHGSLVDWRAVKQVLKFKKEFKPQTTIHLGDVIDYAAFRTGAHGTKDEAMSVESDIAAGIRVIKEFNPTDVLIGNHDYRVWKLSDHYNAIIARAAQTSKNEFVRACAKARLVDHYNINKSWIELGDTKFLHGFMFNENAIRDHAEHFGKCVIAHLHVAGSAYARRSDHAVGYCVGTLADVTKMDYAGTRRATARWSYGFAWGYYNQKECHINLSHCLPEQVSSWVLP